MNFPKEFCFQQEAGSNATTAKPLVKGREEQGHLSKVLHIRARGSLRRRGPRPSALPGTSYVFNKHLRIERGDKERGRGGPSV